MTNSNPQIPLVWLQPIEIDQWTTHDVQVADMAMSFRLHTDWQASKIITPDVDDYAHEIHYRGKQPAEWCIVHHLRQADPNHDLKEWVEAPIAVINFPIIAIHATFDKPPKVMEMSFWGEIADYMDMVGCDDMVAYDGIMRLPANIGGIAHFYIVALRKGTRAWKFELAFHSACMPGTNEETVNRNDHVRAGASLGYVKIN